MTPDPVDMPTIHDTVNRHYVDKESLAAHKFKQKTIMAKAARRDLVVQYFRRQWTFIEPCDVKSYIHSLSDENALAWLSAVPYPRKIGALEAE